MRAGPVATASHTYLSPHATSNRQQNTYTIQNSILYRQPLKKAPPGACAAVAAAVGAATGLLAFKALPAYSAAFRARVNPVGRSMLVVSWGWGRGLGVRLGHACAAHISGGGCQIREPSICWGPTDSARCRQCSDSRARCMNPPEAAQVGPALLPMLPSLQKKFPGVISRGLQVIPSLFSLVYRADTELNHCAQRVHHFH